MMKMIVQSKLKTSWINLFIFLPLLTFPSQPIKQSTDEDKDGEKRQFYSLFFLFIQSKLDHQYLFKTNKIRPIKMMSMNESWMMKMMLIMMKKSIQVDQDSLVTVKVNLRIEKIDWTELTIWILSPMEWKKKMKVLIKIERKGLKFGKSFNVSGDENWILEWIYIWKCNPNNDYFLGKVFFSLSLHPIRCKCLTEKLIWKTKVWLNKEMGTQLISVETCSVIKRSLEWYFFLEDKKDKEVYPTGSFNAYP